MRIPHEEIATLYAEAMEIARENGICPECGEFGLLTTDPVSEQTMCVHCMEEL